MSTSKVGRKAAQYVRMSTDYQQYSTANQKAAISAYAAAHGIEIVVTYEDAGKSGLTVNGRPALRQLIADIAAGQDAFDTILVYDVSRWGRFQDADESAHLEYLCRLGGVRLEYCAEPFSNDGTPFSSICKVVKRALAAEYSRELSEKVFKGQRRLIELGFRQGGSPGIGLRRCIIDCNGRRKGLLKRGQYKNIATDRVILVPGPAKEIAIVKRIYRDYVELGLGSPAIAAALNREGVRSESGRPWTKAVVKGVLTCPKYVGDSVWARSSFKLKIARQRNELENWARLDGAFEPIIDRTLFERAQEVRRQRTATFTKDEVVAQLRAIYRKHGSISTQLVNRSHFLCASAIRKRFGSLLAAYELAGHRPDRDLSYLAHKEAAKELRAATAEAILLGLRSRGLRAERLSGACRFTVNEELRVTVTVAQQRRSQRGQPRWFINPPSGSDDLRIAVLMDGKGERAKAYYFFPSAELPKLLVLAPWNPADFEALRSDSLQPLFMVCARQQVSRFAAHALNDRQADAELPERPVRTMIRSQPPKRKTYKGAFKRASRYMRDAIQRADAVALRLHTLRQTLTGLLADAKLVEILAAKGICNVPYAVSTPERYIAESEERSYRALLRKMALDLLSSTQLSRRARTVLDRLDDTFRAEAAELILLVNDRTAEFATALVAATPAQGLRVGSRKRICGSDRNKGMITERDYLLNTGRAAFASFGRNALDLIALECFARRLTMTQSAVAWLDKNDKVALHILKSA